MPRELLDLWGFDVDGGVRRGGTADAGELPRSLRRYPIAAREQPAAGHQDAAPQTLAPTCPQDLEQLQRQHGVAVLLPLALLDPQQYARGTDVGDFEATTSETRRPAPYATAIAAFALGPGVASKSA